MIRVTLELVPGGSGPPQRLGMIYIGNDVLRTLTSSGKRGDYSYDIEKKRVGRTVHEGVIENFPRLSYHPWNLVRRILNDAAERNGGTI